MTDKSRSHNGLVVRTNLKRRVAVIDLGSNSARLIVVYYTPGQVYQITDEVSRRVRLSEAMGPDNLLRPAPVKRALETLQMFKAFCAANDVTRIIPVATAAVRDAANRDEFLEAVRRATGLEFRVLTGEAEAYYGTLGVVNSLDLQSGLVLDVGGGSAEVSEVRGGVYQRGTTAPLGAVRLTELYLDRDPVRPVDTARLDDHISATLHMLDWMKLPAGGTFVGLGGTVRALARMDREARGYPMGLTHGYELTLERLERLVERLRKLPIDERADKVRGLQADRADIIVAGAMVVAGALRRAGADGLVVCGQGLREGLFYREFLKPANPPVIGNVRRFSILNLARLYGCENAHANHVARLALSLFDQLGVAGRHNYGALERELLWAACQLHDIGTVVDYYDHHKHSAYIIINAGLPGFSHRETALIAQMCLYHRKGTPDLKPYSRLFNKGDLQLVSRLAALLRLAEYLDRSRAQTIVRLKLMGNGKRLRLRTTPRARADARVEIWEGQRNAGLLEEAFKVKLEVV
jgi:exopolyphosphatase/guanosine-5'-triphosphate,3'-diphosphate pyrophosphatase